MTGVDGGVADRLDEVRFPGAGRDGDTLQHLRAALPAEVRVTAATHPLFGRLLVATGFKRWKGVLLLVVTLPDGSPGTVPVDATDILGTPPTEPGSSVLTAEGLRRLYQLTQALRPARQKRSGPKASK